LRAVRKGGCAALLGIPSENVTSDLADRVIFKGRTLLGSNGRRMFETWYQTEELVRSGRVDLKPIITHVIPFDEFERGFAMMRSGEAAKIVLDLKGIA